MPSPLYSDAAIEESLFDLTNDDLSDFSSSQGNADFNLDGGTVNASDISGAVSAQWNETSPDDGVYSILEFDIKVPNLSDGSAIVKSSRNSLPNNPCVGEIASWGANNL